MWSEEGLLLFEEEVKWKSGFGFGLRVRVWEEGKERREISMAELEGKGEVLRRRETAEDQFFLSLNGLILSV